MVRKSILASLAIASGVAVWLVLKNLEDKTQDSQNDHHAEEKEDNEINFIKINDDEGDDEDEEEPANIPVRQAGETAKPEAEPVPETPVNLAEQLKQKNAPQPQPAVQKQPEQTEIPPEIQEICRLYPYLEPQFVADIFKKNAALNAEYPEDMLITIIHRASFPDDTTMEEFGVILQNNGYQTQVLSNTEIEVYKKMFTEDGRIISDIYNVANQVICLGGSYEGYRIQ